MTTSKPYNLYNLTDEDVDFIFKFWLPWEKPALKNATARDFVHWIVINELKESRRISLLETLKRKVPPENFDKPLKRN